jgi:transcriptional regulator with XRE-family HTH domain
MKKDNENIHEIVHRIKTIRRTNHISQHQFYCDTGIHIGRIEQGKGGITLDTFIKICQYFRTPVWEILNNRADLQDAMQRDFEN